MVLNEEDWVDRFIRGFPDNIQRNVIAADPTRLQDAIRIANNLLDQKLKGYTRNAKNNRRFDNNLRVNRGPQPLPFKRQNIGGQNVARAYTTGNNVMRGFGHTTRYCNAAIQRAPFGNQLGVTYYECGRPGHIKKDCPKLRN
ncbi:putative reverse transcriptase domain-containing protein [Tanacetum coccineum]